MKWKMIYKVPYAAFMAVTTAGFLFLILRPLQWVGDKAYRAESKITIWTSK